MSGQQKGNREIFDRKDFDFIQDSYRENENQSKDINTKEIRESTELKTIEKRTSS